MDLSSTHVRIIKTSRKPFVSSLFPKPTAFVYAHLLNMYMSVNDINGALMFDEFHNICTQGKIPWDKV
jgi:hypothetical protein